ncbi:MAG: tetratricopeptide repeat protein [Myxococcales bacterium]|nr:tetratricopeptide repeat protein [Myxococcales bacterium]
MRDEPVRWGRALNVRCPSCSAVFPVADGAREAECPLCLLRFAPTDESTTTLPGIDMPTEVPDTLGPDVRSGATTVVPTTPSGTGAGGPRARSRDPSGGFQEAERSPTSPAAFAAGFGIGTAMADKEAGQTSARTQGDSGLLARAAAVLGGEDSQRIDASKPTSDVAEIGFTGTESGDIDFDSLLSDAVQSVEKRATSPRTNPFGRISAPRSGAGAAADVVGMPTKGRASAPKLAIGAPAAGSDPSSLFEEGDGSHASSDDTIAVDVSAGRDEAVVVARPRPVAAVAARAHGGVSPLARVRRLARALAVLAVLAAMVGMGLEVAGFGWFGSRLWRSADSTQKRDRNRTVAVDLLTPVELLDTAATYEADVQRLAKIVALRPDDRVVSRELVDRLLDFFERSPASFEPPSPWRPRLDSLRSTVQPFPLRYEVLAAVAGGMFDGKAAALAPLDQGTPDDQEVAARLRLLQFERQLDARALDNPGLTSSPDTDPLRASPVGDVAMEQVRKSLDGLQGHFAKARNWAKFEVLHVAVLDRFGARNGLIERLEAITKRAGDHVEARLVLASVQLEQNHLEAAEVLAAEGLRLAQEGKLVAAQRNAWLTMARIGVRRGDRAAQAAALQGALAVVERDEVTLIRLGRLLVADKRSADAHKLFTEARKTGSFKSIAYEVALVEYWLQVNRNPDALEEITEATKHHPDSVDLLFLRGQVEDKEQHFATARDYFSQVIAREPRHLRAIQRLAALQAAAGRHDEALATLERGRLVAGDDEGLVSLISDSLMALNRGDEARAAVAKLLEAQPNNRQYLLRAAQMDLRTGQVDRALGYLRTLRSSRALDREAAVQMARALSDKGQPQEAAATLVPFAENAVEDVALNTDAGRYLIDAKDYDRAQTLLHRATQAANGKNAEALFQYGRLAFRRQDVLQGISRTKQAIGLDPTAHAYRFELARSLFELRERDGAREVALRELRTILSSASQYAEFGRPVTYLAAVHRMIARDHLERFRYGQAIPHLEAVLQLAPDDVDALVEVGRSLYMTASPKAERVLKQVLARRPDDAHAALYLGLVSLNRGKSSEALEHLQRAAAANDPGLAEAWYHIALIHKEREQAVAALRAVNEYLRAARPDDTYRRDAETLQRNLGGAR